MIKRGRKAIYSFKNMTKIMFSPVSDPGIYHHEGLGLISLSSDGTNWITIADKNLGATEVWNFGDAPNENNCGKYYQWGNNYGFPGYGNDEPVETSETKVITTGYGPGNYYYSNIKILASGWIDHNSVNADNLWGGITLTNEAMQGPCPNGFHIGLGEERGNINTIGQTIGARVVNNGGIKIMELCKIPPNKSYGLNVGLGYYWLPKNFYFDETVSDLINIAIITGGVGGGLTTHTYNSSDHLYGIRPFKNTPVQPDTSRTVLYQPN